MYGIGIGQSDFRALRIRKNYCSVTIDVKQKI